MRSRPRTGDPNPAPSRPEPGRGESSRPFWTDHECRELARLAPLGAEAVAEAIGRSLRAVELQATKQGVSLGEPRQRSTRRRSRPPPVRTAATPRTSPPGGRPWSTRELQELARVAPLGAAAAAGILRRSVDSVKMQARRQRISLRREGSRRGAILGQLRGTALPVGVRQAVLNGEADPERVARRMRALFREAAELCPRCSMRPQEVDSTGLCQACHVRELVALYRIESDDLEATRAFDAERAARYRRRKSQARDASRE